MIIVKFYGGLGNQMLQFASFTALQKRYPGAKVVADIRKYNYSGVHNGLELERLFPISLKVLSGKKENKSSGATRYWNYAIHNAVIKFFNAGFKKIPLYKGYQYAQPGPFNLDTNVNYYLDGYWGNEKYFENAKEEISQYFTFKIPLDIVNEGLASKIHSQNAVSLHVRRGDYIGPGSLYVDLTKTSYYSDAFEYLTTNTMDPVFYIFSNDIEWCRANLTWLQKTEHYFVEGNSGMNSYKDMQLLSICKHNIIANSTFSWWGGWLNNNPGKIVICPKTYMYDEVKNNKILAEFYPAAWVKM